MMRFVIGRTFDLLVYADEAWLVARAKLLERIFQRKLNRLKAIIPSSTYKTIVKLLNNGRVREAHELLHDTLDQTLHSFSQLLSDDWDKLVIYFGGIHAVEAHFQKFGPVFDPE